MRIEPLRNGTRKDYAIADELGKSPLSPLFQRGELAGDRVAFLHRQTEASTSPRWIIPALKKGDKGGFEFSRHDNRTRTL